MHKAKVKDLILIRIALSLAEVYTRVLLVKRFFISYF